MTVEQDLQPIHQADMTEQSITSSSQSRWFVELPEKYPRFFDDGHTVPPRWADDGHLAAKDLMDHFCQQGWLLERKDVKEYLGFIIGGTDTHEYIDITCMMKGCRFELRLYKCVYNSRPGYGIFWVHNGHTHAPGEAASCNRE